MGICRNSKGAALVTCITEMPQVTPKMIDWWFGWHMPETERYKLWHPRDHISSKLSRYFGVSNGQRKIHSC